LPKVLAVFFYGKHFWQGLKQQREWRFLTITEFMVQKNKLIGVFG
jgi:hypothetical protein